MSDNQEQLIKDFVRELQTMTESRPPISKAKMMSITKSALKAIKYYKHIVMNVEKFISKCKPEYKIPGLYVIDSIVRQSRHQHGVEKDVYGSRFAKNILNTLHHVEKCPSDDKNKISRVLNLWEKNAIFPPNLIKELFQAHQSMVKTDEFLEKLVPTEKHNNEKALGGTDFNRFRELQETLLRASGSDDPETTSILTEIQQITNQLLGSQKKTSTTNSTIDEPSSTTTSFINTSETMNSNVANVLDDFDYGSDNDDDEPREKTTTTIIQPPSLPSLSQQPPAQQQLTMPPVNLPQQPVQFFQTPSTMLINPNTVSFPMTDANNMSIPMTFDPAHPPPIFFQQPLPSSLSMQQINYNHPHPQMTHQMPPTDVDCRPEDMDADSLDDHRHHHHQYNRRRSRSPSPSSHHSKRTRSSSNSMNRRDSAASRLKETEKRERRRKGLPPLKEDHLVVSSRTVWLGHLPKMITEIDLREHLETHGEINDINHIPPRGCAFICFKERSDAARCLEKMKDFRLHGNTIKIGWATNKGVKDRFKEYWDADHGCTYIPYSDIKNIPNLSTLAEGGVIDDESLPSFLKTNKPSVQTTEVPQLIQQQQPVQQTTQPFIPPQAQFIRPEFQPTTPNRLPQAPTILMAPQHHESPLRLGVPVQMMPPGAQIIQVQQQPHGQPAVQVVQRIGDIGRVFPNSQIVHQMPYGHVVTAAGQPPPTSAIQLQHQDLNGQTLAPGPALIQLHDDGRRQVSPSNLPKHFDEAQRHHMSSTDEQLLRLSTSSVSHFAHPPPPPHHHHHLLPQQQAIHPFANNVLPGQAQSALLPIPTNNDEHKKQSTFPRRPSRFEDRDDNIPTQDNNNNNGNYAGYRGGRTNFNDRGNPNIGLRNPNRGRGAGIPAIRGHYNNANAIDRSDNNDNNGGGYRHRNNFNRGGRGGNSSNNITISHSNDIGGPSRYYSRGGGGHRGGSSHEHRSSRSPDRTLSYRSLPTEALRKIDHTNSNITIIPDETNSNRNEHSTN